jgi:hypothetical protein
MSLSRRLAADISLVAISSIQLIVAAVVFEFEWPDLPDSARPAFEDAGLPSFDLGVFEGEGRVMFG